MTEQDAQPVQTTPPALPARMSCACGHARRRRFFAPLLHPALQSRGPALTLGLLGVTQVGLTMCHVSGWPCPFLYITGIPCPGCGATRSCVALLRGQWGLSLRMHALGAGFLIAIVMLLIGGLLPDRPRKTFIAATEWIESRTGAGFFFIVALLIYWLARLASDPHGFIRLIKA